MKATHMINKIKKSQFNHSETRNNPFELKPLVMDETVHTMSYEWNCYTEWLWGMDKQGTRDGRRNI